MPTKETQKLVLHRIDAVMVRAVDVHKPVMQRIKPLVLRAHVVHVISQLSAVVHNPHSVREYMYAQAAVDLAAFAAS